MVCQLTTNEDNCISIFTILKIAVAIELIILSVKYYEKNRKEIIVSTPKIDKYISLNYSNYIRDDRFKYTCQIYDPYNLFKERFRNPPISLCKSNYSEHLCYLNTAKIQAFKNGVTCLMSNFTIDPSKWKSDGYTYLGPVDNITRGMPLLSKGFFSMECQQQDSFSEKYDSNYDIYFDAWNYTNYTKEDENIEEKNEELAPGKVIFFVSRNQDSPNLFWGFNGIMNAALLINLFKLNPEDIQVVFLESIKIDKDPLYEIYKNVISRGGEPIHINQLNKTYHITEAIHVPINWDSPCFSRFLSFQSSSSCPNSTIGYTYINDLINKYMNISYFIEPKSYDKEVFYYPKKVKDPNSPEYTSFITIQWRKAWPRGRKGQGRLLGNGPEIVERLYQVLPKTILIRLVDTSNLTLSEQISLMKKTDYFLGIHGAGLLLSLFLPPTSILHEITPTTKTKNLASLSKLSGHRTISERIKGTMKKVEGTEYVYFNTDILAQKVMQTIKEYFFYIRGKFYPKNYDFKNKRIFYKKRFNKFQNFLN